MKNKLILITIALILTVSCSQLNFITVRIKLDSQDKFNLSDYEKILYHPFSISPPFTHYKPEPTVLKFFMGDFAKAINEDVTQTEMVNDYFIDKVTFLSEAQKYPNSIIILGKINIKVDKRSVIKEQESNSGKQKKFVQIQHWNMTTEISIIETDSGKEIYNNKFTQKMANADPKTVKFNFDAQFFKTMDQFIQSIEKVKKTQKRFLLIK